MQNKKITVLKNARLITPVRIIKNGILVIKDGKIADVGARGEVIFPRNARVIDVEGRYVSPGFIDIHLHGGGGADTMDATEEAIEKISVTHAKGGSTSIVPTTITAPMEDIIRAIENIEIVRKKDLPGANVLGVHVEGPYFSSEQRGAQNPKFLKEPKPEEYLGLLDRYDCIIRVSAAPEIRGGLELGQELRKRGILASIAHTNATYQDILRAIEAGYTHVTHMYSGMSGLKRINAYRVSGVIESTLLLDELTTEIIADGHHLPPSLIKLILKAKGLDKVSIITDAMSAAGLGPGKYFLGGLDVVVEDDVAGEFEVPEEEGNYVAKLLTRDAFAGSAATMDKCVKNMVKLVGLSIQDAVKMATINPAKLIGVEDKKGSLVKGKDADIVIFDENINIIMTIVGGKIVYKKGK
ncbi:MAG TPA: N-acetylglucosamine-6-phosphate deacetylase [Candidatus Aerophobetes bacterium]|uniref:N-acetylglucosamine-6-phosphate deacetylase n=1 Tax=Aerophobetes bacterium TaxID=2030807 RepID=A0A7V0QTE9_UNCAE|nr:N-acetylglucosamine-6-phosphate deacetylase [Candidatus Aerophobetes bacterium]